MKQAESYAGSVMDISHDAIDLMGYEGQIQESDILQYEDDEQERFLKAMVYASVVVFMVFLTLAMVV